MQISQGYLEELFEDPDSYPIKANPTTKRDIANKLKKSQGTFYYVTKHTIKSQVKKKPNVHQLTQAKVEQRWQRLLRLYVILNARKTLFQLT